MPANLRGATYPAAKTRSAPGTASMCTGSTDTRSPSAYAVTPGEAS